MCRTEPILGVRTRRPRSPTFWSGGPPLLQNIGVASCSSIQAGRDSDRGSLPTSARACRPRLSRSWHGRGRTPPLARPWRAVRAIKQTSPCRLRQPGSGPIYHRMTQAWPLQLPAMFRSPRGLPGTVSVPFAPSFEPVWLGDATDGAPEPPCSSSAPARCGPLGSFRAAFFRVRADTGRGDISGRTDSELPQVASRAALSA